MPDVGRVHRFRDHDIAGVNWRPTRFVDDVPSPHVCGLCRMIPKRTVLLPCGHFLCQLCHAASSQGGCSGRCPLDQEDFEEKECSSCDLPTRKVNALKVYCWNEAHGCKYEGTMEDVLRHFESGCTFHSVECLRCGEAVLHRELATHYVSGCRTSVSSAPAQKTLSESTTLSLEDVRNVIQEVKTLLGDPNRDQMLPEIQSQVNELTERVRNQESRLAEITGEAGSSVNVAIAQQAVAASSILQESASRENTADRARTSTSPLSCSQDSARKAMLQTLFDVSPHVVEQMQKTSTQDFPQHAIEYAEPPYRVCHLVLTRPLSPTHKWTEVREAVMYVLALENCAFPLLERGKLRCRITVLHTMDAYFVVQVYDDYHNIFGDRFNIGIDFRGKVYGSCWIAPFFQVSAYNRERNKALKMTPRDLEIVPFKDEHSRVRFTSVFEITRGELERGGFFRHAMLEFKIELQHLAS